MTLIAGYSPAGRKTAIVISEQSLLRLDHKHKGGVRRVALWALPRLYPRADAVIALSKGVRDELVTYIPALKEHLYVIPNAGFDNSVKRLAQEPVDDASLVEGATYL